MYGVNLSSAPTSGVLPPRLEIYLFSLSPAPSFVTPTGGGGGGGGGVVHF